MDGITYLLPRKDLNKAKQIGEEMTKLTGLYIEDNEYSKFIVRDVNNYLAVYTNGDIKYKGCFEIDKEFHKDPSMRIVPIAIKEYFVNGKSVRETIENHSNIFDFCLRFKTNSKSTPIFRHINNEEIKDVKLNRTTRYYISNISKDSGILLKDFGDDRISGVNIGFNVTLFNNYVKKDIKNYNINYNFYIAEAMKIINAIEDGGQLNLF